MAAPYTDQQLSDFWWWGVGGSETDILPDAWVLKHEGEAIALTNPQSATYNATLASLAAYCFTNRLFGYSYPRTGFDGTGTNGEGWNGPTKS